MAKKQQTPTGPEARLTRSIVQRLESLRQAGITHLPKPRAPDAPRKMVEKPAATVKKMPEVVAAPSPAVEPQPSIVAEKTALPPDVDRASALAAIELRVRVCTRCAELARTRKKTVFGSGNPSARLVFMGEAPGADEDQQGLPFVGRAGQLLTDMIEKGMRIRRPDVFILNTLKCRPPNNRMPTRDEAANCREYLDAQLDAIRPEFICCLGAVAAQNLLNTTQSIGRLRGRVHDYRGMKVICTYHPAYLLRSPDVKRDAWKDLQFLMREMGLPLPKK